VTGRAKGAGSQSARDLLNAALMHAWNQRDPWLGWSIGHLGGVADVRYSGEVDTACIRRQGERFAILFSQAFASEHLKEPADALFVLLHEIFHKVNGDLYRDSVAEEGPVGRQVANIVADARINACLCKRFFPAGPPILEAFYGESGFPGILLLSPQGLHRIHGGRGPAPEWADLAQPWGRRDLRITMAQALRDMDLGSKASAEMAGWYVDAWTKDPSFQNLFDRLRPHFAREPEVRFLGDHSGEGRPLPGLDKLLGMEGLEGGRGGDAEDDDVEVAAVPRIPGKLLAAVARALAPDPTRPRDALAFFPDRSVVCRPGRRDLFMMALGLPPLFYSQPVYCRGEEDHRVHLYIDVSASTRQLQPFLYGLALHLGDLIGEPAYLFSNRVWEVSLGDLSRGVVRTTRGTDFNCVAEHAAENRFQKILVVTDGMAGISSANEELLRSGGIRVYLMLTEACGWCPLEPLASETWNLSEFGVFERGPARLAAPAPRRPLRPVYDWNGSPQTSPVTRCSMQCTANGRGNR